MIHVSIPTFTTDACSVSLRASARLNIKCGLYVHVPWPSSDLLKCLPVRTELLRGMLTFDLVGFQIFDYARHFLTACTRLLGVTHVFKMGGFLTLEYNNKSVQLSSKHLCLPADYARRQVQHSQQIIVGIPDRDFVPPTGAVYSDEGPGAYERAGAGGDIFVLGGMVGVGGAGADGTN